MFAQQQWRSYDNVIFMSLAAFARCALSMSYLKTYMALQGLASAASSLDQVPVRHELAKELVPAG
jgi:hypothetical protein